MLDKLLERLKDSHIPIALLVFAVTTVVMVIKGDIGAQYTSSLYAMYAFLAGHSFVNRDKDNQS